MVDADATDGEAVVTASTTNTATEANRVVMDQTVHVASSLEPWIGPESGLQGQRCIALATHFYAVTKVMLGVHLVSEVEVVRVRRSLWESAWAPARS